MSWSSRYVPTTACCRASRSATGSRCRQRASDRLAAGRGSRELSEVALEALSLSEVAPGAPEPSEVAPPGLLALDCLEQRLEVALAEALRAVPLDQLEEHRRPVLHGLGEYLQQVAVLVPVRQDPELPQLIERNASLADPFAQRVVIAVRRGQEVDAHRAHAADGRHDVIGGQGDVLDAGAAVALQVLVDLG